jgi:hypothetical protein
MKSKKSRVWLVIEPAIGVAVGVFVMVQWAKGAVAHAWSRL